MPIYYDAQAFLPRFYLTETVFPRVLRSLEFWLCIATHACLVALLRMEHLQPLEEGHALVPVEFAFSLFLLAIMATAVHLVDCHHWHRALSNASSQVGDHTRVFVQELQATFGRTDEVVTLRFVAAKYALAAVYVYFFAATSGAVTHRCWGELRAKGLLNDREVQFMEGQYSGDRIALLHVWAMWAAQEAAMFPAVRARASPEALAGSLSRLSAALGAAATAAREAANCMAQPVPYHKFQLHETLTMASLLAMAVVAATPTAASSPAASAAYLVILLVMLGLREAAALSAEPFRPGGGFPVVAAVNTTADAVVQLLIASTTPTFDPTQGWWDAGQAVFSQGQIERRTPEAVFGNLNANPCHWREVKPPVMGDQAPPPLLDVGCCHVDVDALPNVSYRKKDRAYQLARRPRQDGVGALLKRLQAALPISDPRGSVVTKSGESTSTGPPSEVHSEKSAARAVRSPCGCVSEPGDTELDPSAEGIAQLPRDQSGAGDGAHAFCAPPRVPQGHASTIESSRAWEGLLRLAETAAELGGKWANPAEEPRVRGGASVSPADDRPTVVAGMAPVGAPRPVGGVTAPRHQSLDRELPAGPAPRCLARSGVSSLGPA